MNGTARGIPRIFAAIALLILGFGTMIVGVTTTAAAAPNDHQITICHATGSQSNPYTMPHPAKQQIWKNAGHKSGGGVHPGDIIPPFSAGSQGANSWGAFGGQNWDAAGQDIYNNGCNIPEGPGEQPEPEVDSTSNTESDCESETVTTTTQNLKAEYTLVEGEWVLGDFVADGAPIVDTRDMNAEELEECAEVAPGETIFRDSDQKDCATKTVTTIFEKSVRAAGADEFGPWTVIDTQTRPATAKECPGDNPGVGPNEGGNPAPEVLGIEANAPAAAVAPAAAAPTAIDAGLTVADSGTSSDSSMLWILAGAAFALAGLVLGFGPAPARGKHSV